MDFFGSPPEIKSIGKTENFMLKAVFYCHSNGRKKKFKTEQRKFSKQILAIFSLIGSQFRAQIEREWVQLASSPS